MIKTAVVGMKWGYYHALNIKNKRIPGVKLVAVCDTNPEKSFFKNDPGVPLYKEINELLAKEKIDAVILAIPHHLHYEYTIKCLDKKIPVYIEKPIAQDTNQAEKMIESAEKNNCVLVVGHQRRFSGYTMKLKHLLKNRIDKITGIHISFAGVKEDEYFKIEWHREKGAGPLLINHIHDIDDLRFIAGEIKNVCGFISNRIRNLEVEDTCVGFLELESGIPVDLFASDVSVRVSEYSHIFYGKTETYAIPPLVKFVLDKKGERKTINLKFPQTDSLLLCEKEFFSAIKENRKLNSPVEAYKNLKVIEALKESWIKKKVIPIK